jgi:hypothetical protein
MARHLSLNCGASGASPVTLLNLDPQLTFRQAATSATKHPLNRSFFKLMNQFESPARIFLYSLIKTFRRLLVAPAPRNFSRRIIGYFDSRLPPFPYSLERLSGSGPPNMYVR